MKRFFITINRFKFNDLDELVAQSNKVLKKYLDNQQTIDKNMDITIHDNIVNNKKIAVVTFR